jgi:hypothetical protein
VFAVSINLSDFRAATLLLHLFQSRCPVNIRYIMELQTCNCGWHLFVLSLHDGSITLLFIFILVLTVSRWPSQVKCHGALSICSVFTSNFFFLDILSEATLFNLGWCRLARQVDILSGAPFSASKRPVVLHRCRGSSFAAPPARREAAGGRQ